MTVSCLCMSPYNIRMAMVEPKIINPAKHELTLLEQYLCLCTSTTQHTGSEGTLNSLRVCHSEAS